jgi:large subunit ribosomal protein L13
MEHIIDAKGKAIGRVATEAAAILLGKDHPTTSKKNVVSRKRVKIINAAAINISEKKENQKTYYRHTGYPGGDRKTSLKQIIKKKGKGSALRTAIYGMLPKNTLRDKRMKQLTIEE